MPSIYELESELVEVQRKLAKAEQRLAGALVSEKKLRKIIGAILTVTGDSPLGKQVKSFLPVPTVFTSEELSQ